ncbi:SMR family transporter [uncultured Stenotrophomonas sp.]|uniref:DMT family transporter n=1 Tax=uncultured Stenotrophomonas sp. TaxID=165438 RepID=UPI0025EA89EE|nr:SMR family transporter [uncultured Stenotrophomonas sp.]
MKWIILALGILANASASGLIKLAVSVPRSFPSLNAPMDALRNWPFWLGLVLYGMAFVLYSASLTRLPLNVAHPISTAGAIGLVACISIVLFKEPMGINVAAGILLIVAGVVLISLKPI